MMFVWMLIFWSQISETPRVLTYRCEWRKPPTERQKETSPYRKPASVPPPPRGPYPRMNRVHVGAIRGYLVGGLQLVGQ